MNVKKSLTAGLLLAVATAGLWTGRAYAETNDTSLSIVDRLAERFDLNAGEVEATFDEIQQEQMENRQRQMQERLEKNLGEAVDDGVITEDQKQALLNKHKEMMTQHRKLREEWQAWVQESGIDFDQLREYGLGHWGRSFRGRNIGRGKWMGRGCSM